MSDVQTLNYNGHTLEYDQETQAFITPLDEQSTAFWVGEFVGFYGGVLRSLEEFSSNPKYANAVKAAGPAKIAATVLGVTTTIENIHNADTPQEAFGVAAQAAVDFFFGVSSAYLGTLVGA